MGCWQFIISGVGGPREIKVGQRANLFTALMGPLPPAAGNFQNKNHQRSTKAPLNKQLAHWDKFSANDLVRENYGIEVNSSTTGTTDPPKND